MAAAVKIWKGGIVMRNAEGFVTGGATATDCIGVGRAEATVDNSAGLAGAAGDQIRSGVFGFANSSAGDAITQSDIGKLCCIVDDQTVAKTDASSTRSPAGIAEGLEGSKVGIRLEEAVTRGGV